MSWSKRHFLPSLLAVVTLQTAALGYIVVNRDQLLKHGREIIVKVQPVDPRDLFRGDYVVLGYPMTQIALKEDKLPDGIEKGSTFYAVLIRGEDDAWSVKSVSATYPASLATDDVVMRGRVQSVFTGPDGKGFTLNARYGIETYFVPEGSGRKIEEQVRDHSVKAVIVVGADGEGALKGLIVGNERTDYPPIF